MWRSSKIRRKKITKKNTQYMKLECIMFTYESHKLLSRERGDREIELYCETEK